MTRSARTTETSATRHVDAVIWDFAGVLTNPVMSRLEELSAAYNSSFHRTINCTPNSVSYHNENEIRRRLCKPKKTPVRYAFAIGDKVRISKSRQPFDKS